MFDTKGVTLAISYVVELVIGIVTVFYLESDSGYFVPAVVIGGVAALVFVIISLTEVVQSVRIRVTEKILWIIGMVMLFNITGLFYLFIRRRII